MDKTLYQAPDFTLPDSENQQHILADYRGKWVVLYFYFKDDTPGCTVEACSLRDSRDDLAGLGAEVIGISRDSTDSHQQFRAKHRLNFTLLSDTDGTVVEAYGAGLASDVMATRKTFIINPDGYVVKVYDDVTPEGHGEQILSDLSALK